MSTTTPNIQIPEINLDGHVPSNSSSGKFPVAPKGTYLAELMSEPEMGVGAKGPYLNWALRLRDPQWPVRIWTITSFAEGDFTRKRLKDMLLAVGLTGKPDFNNLPPLTGRIFEVDVRRAVDDYKSPDEDGAIVYKNEIDAARPWTPASEEMGGADYDENDTIDPDSDFADLEDDEDDEDDELEGTGI